MIFLSQRKELALCVVINGQKPSCVLTVEILCRLVLIQADSDEILLQGLVCEPEGFDAGLIIDYTDSVVSKDEISIREEDIFSLLISELVNHLQSASVGS